MNRILIFAGTTEGRKLVEETAGHIAIDVCVATEYGKMLLPEKSENLRIFEGRLDENEMFDMIKEGGYDMVIDTTHPYAAIVSKNISNAARKAETEYIRLLRDESFQNVESVEQVASIEEAVEYLNKQRGRILLTTGSKEIAGFKGIEDFKERVYARVLPMEGVVASCIENGVEPAHLICMQGPFSVDLNVALIRQIGAKVIVTKDGGSVGGFEAKLRAAEITGSKLVVIGRPQQDAKALSYAEIMQMLAERYGINRDKIAAEEQQERASDEGYEWFPIFTNIADMKVLIVGGGAIATRRAEVLSKFKFDITVVAPKLSEGMRRLEKSGVIRCEERKFDEADLKGAEMVLAATDDDALNGSITKKAAAICRYYNSSSNREDCNFYFPAIISRGSLTLGMTAQGKNHKLVKEVRSKVEAILDSTTE